MSRARLAALLAVTALLAGCGGGEPAPSDKPAGSAPPSGPATAVPASDTGAAAPAPASGGSYDGSIGRDIEKARVAAARAVRTWGVSAERACRKAEREIDPWLARLLRFKAPTGRRASAAEVKRAGKLIVEYARAAEYEYELLRGVTLPTEAEAVDQIQAFFDKEEEALMLMQRLGIELQKRNDAEGFFTSLARLRRLSDDYRRAGRAVGALSCVDDD